MFERYIEQYKSKKAELKLDENYKRREYSLRQFAIFIMIFLLPYLFLGTVYLEDNPIINKYVDSWIVMMVIIVAALFWAEKRANKKFGKRF